MKGDEDSSRLHVFLESLLCFGSVRSLLVSPRDISPSLPLARERLAIQTFVPSSSTVPLRAFCDCTINPMLRASR
jgi:hypothetical protein